ncbi:MAG: cytochrome c [Planctomycetes bacterium]|nr:cytochrome c [Planctomycetota bacterium]
MKVTHLIAVIALAVFVSCRGGVSKHPPIHLVPDMDDQPYIQAQEDFDFPTWTDKRGMRMPVAGTIAQGTLDQRALGVYEQGGRFVDNPIAATYANLARGQERFNIYCAVCHDRAGSGKGVVMQRAPAGSFNAVLPNLATEERLQAGKMKDGELFKTITEGKATMPAYGHMIPAEDRWKIVHYLRALQHRITE